MWMENFAQQHLFATFLAKQMKYLVQEEWMSTHARNQMNVIQWEELEMEIYAKHIALENVARMK
jgi:hypothetical protein